MDNQDGTVQHAIDIVQNMLNLGESILALSDGLDASKEALSLMDERTRLFEKLTTLKLPRELRAEGAVREEELEDEGNVGEGHLHELLQQLYSQNRRIRPLLEKYLGLIDEQVQLSETSLKAAKSYGTSDHLRTIARGFNVDESL